MWNYSGRLVFFLKPFFFSKCYFLCLSRNQPYDYFLFLLLGSQREGVLGKYFFLFISITIFNTVGNGKELFAMNVIVLNICIIWKQNHSKMEEKIESEISQKPIILELIDMFKELKSIAIEINKTFLSLFRLDFCSVSQWVK